MNQYVKTVEPNLVRDTASNAILNTDVESLEAYKKLRNRAIRSDTLVEDVDNLKRDLTEIKSLLAQLVNDKYSKSC